MSVDVVLQRHLSFFLLSLSLLLIFLVFLSHCLSIFVCLSVCLSCMSKLLTKKNSDAVRRDVEASLATLTPEQKAKVLEGL